MRSRASDPREASPAAWLLPALLVAAAALPLLIAPVPLLIDLPSHLARYHVEQAIGGDPALQRYFTYGWRYLPNLGVDVLVAGAGRLIGVELASRMVVAAIPALGTAGMLWVGHTVHGRLTFATLLATSLNYAFPLTFGFVNSCLSVSLAWCAFGAWLAIGSGGKAWRRSVFAALAAPVVLTAHVIGFGVLGLMIAGAAFAEGTRLRLPPLRLIGSVARAALPLAWPLLILLFWRTGDTAVVDRWFDWRLELQWLVMVMRDRFLALDVGTALILYLAALLPLIAARRFAAARTLLWPALLVWMVVLVMPNRVFGSEFAAVRLIPVALGLSILAVHERGAPRPALLTASVALVAIRLTITASTLFAASSHAQQILGALPAITPGSRVAAIRLVSCERRWTPVRFDHIASYATVRRDAVTNGQFATVEGQLLGIKPAVTRRLVDLPTSAAATTCPRLFPPTALPTLVATLGEKDADYLWLIDTGGLRLPLPRSARLIWSDGQSRVYDLRGVR